MEEEGEEEEEGAEEGQELQGKGEAIEGDIWVVLESEVDKDGVEEEL